jgi:hypothetical protein
MRDSATGMLNRRKIWFAISGGDTAPRDICEATGCTRYAVHWGLRQLVADGYIVGTGRTHCRDYSIVVGKGAPPLPTGKVSKTRANFERSRPGDELPDADECGPKPYVVPSPRPVLALEACLGWGVERRT